MELSRDVYRGIYFPRTLSPRNYQFLDMQPEEWNALGMFIEELIFIGHFHRETINSSIRNPRSGMLSRSLSRNSIPRYATRGVECSREVYREIFF